VSTDDVSSFRIGGGLTALGAAGVVVASASYAAAPVAAALPGPLDPVLAHDGAQAGAAWLHMAGVVGACSDVPLLIGCALVALALLGRGEPRAAVGWLALAVGTAVFVAVDVLAGYALGPLAAQAGADGAFVLAKRMFDAAFLLGTATFGAGMLIALGECVPVSRRFKTASRAIGAIAFVAALAGLAGAPLARAVGLSVAASALLYAAVGLQLAKGQRVAR
jgi:hypothetical protein